MAARHTKMYAGSPRIESDDAGKKVIKKGPSEGEKKTSEAGSGTDGVPAHEVHIKHEKERHDLYLKQSKDFMDMHARHLSEMGPSAPAGINNPTNNDSAQGE